MSIPKVLAGSLRSLRIALANGALNCLPDDTLSERLRPFIARLFGLKSGRGVRLRRAIYYGNFARIVIGDRTAISREVFLDAYDRITIGNGVGIGFRTTLITSSHHQGPPARRAGGELRGVPIVIEDGVWIGAGATIGPGVTVGAGSIVMAGAVVLRSMPPNSLISGNPARVVGRIEDDPEQAGASS